MAAAALWLLAALAPAQWFESDGAGIAYGSLAKSAALRLDWAVEIRFLEQSEVDAETAETAASVTGTAAAAATLPAPVRVEARTLFRSGTEHRRTLSFIDGAGVARQVRTKSADGAVRVERYDSRRRLVEETDLAPDGSLTVVEFQWDDDRLKRAVARNSGVDEGEILWTDSYRYDRSGSLVSVDRIPDGSRLFQRSSLGLPRVLETRSPEGAVTRTRFDELGRPSEISRTASAGGATVTEKLSYETSLPVAPSVALRESGPAAPRVRTKYDEKGRIVLEEILNEAGEPIESTLRVWSGDRVQSIARSAAGIDRLTEYGYASDGSRILQRDYRDGVLERTVRKEGTMEFEELFKNGKLVLRASYENGALLREERIR